MKKHGLLLLLLPVLAHAQPTLEECAPKIRDLMTINEVAQECFQALKNDERATRMVRDTQRWLPQMAQCKSIADQANEAEEQQLKQLLNYDEYQKLPALWASLNPAQRQARCTRLFDEWETINQRHLQPPTPQTYPDNAR